jgi:hypothetical protein
MNDEPAEEEEIFQYEMLKEMRKISKTLESLNSNIEKLAKAKEKK